MRLRTRMGAAALYGAVLTLSLLAGATTSAGQDVGVSVCNQSRWCTITASGDVTQFASQLAIGNASAGTPLAVTALDVGQDQVGGEILSGSLRGTCGWSQYDRDWTAGKILSLDVGCADPVLTTAEFVADNGKAVWSGCYPRCFGGVPLRYDKRCGKPGHNWCYGSNCEEFANFYPWTAAAHVADPVRMTHRHRLDVRYMTRYGDAWTHTPFYLVRDVAAVHGTGNWVFISADACDVHAGAPGSYHWLAQPAKPHHKAPTAHAAHTSTAPSA